MTSPTLLLVDPYDTSRVALAELLREWGFGVLPVSSEAEAMRAVGEQRPALAIVDAWPSESRALRMVEQLRHVPDAGRIPVVVLTATPSDVRNQSGAGGCHVVLEKPFGAGRLQRELGRILGTLPVAAYAPMTAAVPQ
jgi:CheY-like chemotaxis protein